MIKRTVIFFLTFWTLAVQSLFAVDIMNMPKIDAFVEDFSNVLSQEALTYTTELAQNHEKETGEQAVSVLFPTRNGYELADIGLKIFRENGIGSREKDDGILLLIATHERKIRIITWYGMEGKVPDILAKRWIEDDIRPRVESWDFAWAVNIFYERLSELKDIEIDGLPFQKKIESSMISWGEKLGSLIYVLLFIPFFGLFFAARIQKKYFFQKVTQLYYSPKNKTLYKEGSTYHDKYYLMTGTKDLTLGDTFFERGYYSLDDWFEENKYKKLISAWYVYLFPVLVFVASGILGLIFAGPIVTMVWLILLSPLFWIFGLVLYFTLHPWLRESLQNGDAIIYSANALVRPIDVQTWFPSSGGFGWGWFGGWGFRWGGGSSGWGGAGD